MDMMVIGVGSVALACLTLAIALHYLRAVTSTVSQIS